MVQEKQKDETTFSAVLDAVKAAMAAWPKFGQQVRVMEDSNRTYWAIIELEHCMGEIIVNEPKESESTCPSG